MALLVVTAGEGVRERAQAASSNGEYLKSHAIAALAIETAEATAECLHRRLRERRGGSPIRRDLHDPAPVRGPLPGQALQLRLPGLPRSGRARRALFAALGPEEIGVELTEGMMMDPEASVSALVFHHPDCTYFSARGTRPR